MNPNTTPGYTVASKRRISRWKKEWKSRRIIAILVVIVIIASIGIVAYGYYDKNVKPWNQTVIKVNDQTIDMRHFVKMMRLYGAEESSSQLSTIVQYSIAKLQNNELIRQKAEKYSIYADDISDAEIEEELKNQMGFDATSENEDDFQQQLKDILDERNVSRSDLEELFIIPSILNDKLFDAIGENEFSDQYEHAHIKAVLVGTEEDAVQVKADWDDFNKILKDYSPARYYPEGGYWLVMITEGDGEGEEGELYINAILLATEDKADDVADKFTGDNFADLAETYSLDSSSEDGGDMGWLSLDDIESKFGEANLDSIQTLDIDTLSDPICENYPDGPVEWLPSDIESSTFDTFVFANGSESDSASAPVRDLNYTTKGGYWLIMVYTPEEEEDHDEDGLYIKAILLDSKAKADELRTDINNGTYEFADIAADYSLDTSSRDNGGDIGFLSEDSIESRFGEDNLDTIKDLTVNTLSQPLKDEDTSKKSGYWVIQVLEKGPRTLSEDNQYSYSAEFFITWSDNQAIEDYILDDNDKLEWAIDHL